MTDTIAPSHPVTLALSATQGPHPWLPVGERVALRRCKPGDIGGTGLYRFLARLRETGAFVPASGPDADDAERRWTCMLAACERLPHKADLSLGAALADAGYHEARLERLLRADDSRSLTAIDHAVRYLAAKGSQMNLYDLHRLLFTTGSAVESIRRGLARQFYGRLHALSKST